MYQIGTNRFCVCERLGEISPGNYIRFKLEEEDTSLDLKYVETKNCKSELPETYFCKALVFRFINQLGRLNNTNFTIESTPYNKGCRWFLKAVTRAGFFS